MNGGFRMLSRRCFVQLIMAAGAVTVGAAALSGCSQGSGEDGVGAGDGAKQGGAGTVKIARPATVTDAKGREVAVPERIERIGITCMGGALQTMSVLGGADRVVVTPSPAKSSPLLLEIFPQYESLPDAGTFDDVNIETIAAAEPDFVFVPSTSGKGNAQIEDIGIATYTLSTANASAESLRQEYQNVGVLLGTEDIAAELVGFWDDLMGRVEKGVSALPEGERLTVYRCAAAITKASHTPWASNWIRTAGGVPVADDGTTGDVSLEKIAAWDPDVISTSAKVEGLLNDPSLQKLKAIKNGAVYKSPKGCMGWDTPSPEVPLGFAWLAQMLYPDRFEDIDLEKEAKGFYERFYHYDLTDEGYQAFFK